MVDRIIKEKTSADHLLYFSLKYTKTCDVILNLIERWTAMIDVGFDVLIENLIKKKKLKKLPDSPKQKIEYIRDNFKNNKIIQDTLLLYIFFRKVPQLNKIREGEFRKNLNLKILEPGGKETNINIEKLKEYVALLDSFIKEIKLFVAK